MKTAVTLSGMAFLGLIGLMFYWLYWDEDAIVQVKRVETQLGILEQFWNQQSGMRDGRLSIGYSDITASGFPFGMRVRLLKPYLRDSYQGRIFMLTASYVDLIPLDEQVSGYRLEYPKEGYAVRQVGASKQNYYLTLSDGPMLWARKHEVGGKMPSAVNEYGMQSPPHLIFTADSSGKVQRYPIKLTSTEEPIWRPIFRNLRERLHWLDRLLQQGLGAR